MRIGKDRESSPPLTPVPDFGNLLMLSLRQMAAPALAKLQRFVLLAGLLAGAVGAVIATVLLAILRGTL